MKTRRQQQGMTMWGMLMIAIIAAFFALLGLKLFPPYMTNMKVKSVLSGIAEQAANTPMSNLEVLEGLNKRFQIDDLDRKIVLKDVVSFEKEGRARIVRIAYDDITPIFANIYVLIEFDNSAEVGQFEE